jgi:hypothetical protein
LAQAIQPVLSVIGLDLDQPTGRDWKRLIGELANTVEPAIFCAKRIHRRQRPAQYCGPDVNPYFKQAFPLPTGEKLPHLLYPGHPSYPSGHATMAYAWVFLIAGFKPAYLPRLEKAARQVAWNRVVAGLHFPTDGDGGRAFAVEIAAQIMKAENEASQTFVSNLREALGSISDADLMG